MRSPGSLLREVLRSRRLARERRWELEQHVAMQAEELERRGLTPREARRQARLELGDPAAVAEDLRDGRFATAVETLGMDLWRAARVVSRSPGFALTGVALVALGVAASTSVLALFTQVVLRPLPYPQADRLVRVWETSPERGVERAGVSRGNAAALRRSTVAGADGTGADGAGPVLDGLAIGYAMGRTLTHGSESEVVLSAQVTADFFRLFGVRTPHGRPLTEEECERARYSSANGPVGADPVLVLGHGLFTRRFGGDPSIVGKTITLERTSFRVVGVMPPGFALPERGADVYLGWSLTEERMTRDQRYPAAFARLAPGVTLATAQARLRAAALSLSEETPATNRGWGVVVEPLHADRVSGVRPALVVLLGAVGILLLIACGNVAILLLARGLSRARESALRLSLGATRARLAFQLVSEALVLALVGGALGTALAALTIAAVRRLAPDLPRVEELSLDGQTLAFALGATLLAALVSALAPAIQASRLTPGAALSGGARSTVGPASGGLFRGVLGRRGGADVLVSLEVALTVVLLAGAGLLVKSVHLLGVSDDGFDPKGVLVAPVFLDSREYGTSAKVRAYYERLFERLRALPGVVSVGGSTALPTSPLGPNFERPVWPERRAGDESATSRPDGAGGGAFGAAVEQAAVRVVTTEYFQTLGIPVVEGRPFDVEDGPEAPRRVILSRSLARRMWPREPAVGQSLVIDYSTAGTYPYEVVGVVEDVRFGGPKSAPGPEVYVAHAQRAYLILNVAVRVAGTEAASRSLDVRRAFLEVDPHKPPHSVELLSDLVASTYARERHVMRLLVGFGLLACFLSACGVYGLLAYWVRERRREIGVRVALGATRARVVSLVAWEGGRLLIAGAALGLAAALFATRLLGGLLYGVSPTDPLTALATLLILGGVGLAASCLPALRATRIEPAEALRAM